MQTLSNVRDRCTPPLSLAEEYRKEMQQKIDDAETAARDVHEIPLMVSRQTYRDLVEAYRFLRQINPLYKSIGQRLEKLSLQIRDGLDRRGLPAMVPLTYIMQPVCVAHAMGISHRRMLNLVLCPFGVWL